MGEGGFSAQGLYYDITEGKMGKADDDLRREFPVETARLERAIDRIIHRDDYAHVDVEYCEKFNVQRQGMCNAALMGDGSCPYAIEHGDEFDQR